MARRTHKDIEFAVDDASGRQRIFKTWDEAAGFATSLAASGRDVNLDVLAYSEAGARAFMGDDGVEEYREDPDASVFMRLKVSVDDQGRVR
jgi:hypothetical protein